MDTRLARDADRRLRIVTELLALLGKTGRNWTPSPAFDRAVMRWSRQLETPPDVLVLVAEARAAQRLSRAQAKALEHVSMVAVGAVSQRLVREALTDNLTGLPTRARMEDEVQHLVAASLRHRSPLTAVVLDVDGLKRINDTQGHSAGDAAIAEVGRAIRAHLRKVDRAFRVGGDEFVLLLPDTAEDAARAVVERIQRHCSTSVSVGMATHGCGPADADVTSWLQRADAQMYEQRQQLRTLLQPPERTSARTRAVGLVLATGVSVGAWAGVAGAVHTAVSDATPTKQTAPPTASAGPSAASTVALPRTIGPRVLTDVPTTPRPAPSAKASPNPESAAPPLAVPSVAVPTLPVPSVAPVEPPGEPPASRGPVGGLVHTVRELLRGVV